MKVWYEMIVNVNDTCIYDPSLILFSNVTILFNYLHSDNLANFTRFGVWSGVISAGFAKTEKFWLTSLQKRCQSNLFCLDESSLDDIAVCFLEICVCTESAGVCYKFALGQVLVQY